VVDANLSANPLDHYRIQLLLRLRCQRQSGIFFGVIAVIAGIVVLAWPVDSIAILTLVVGIWLVVIGVFEIMAAFVIRRDVTTLRDTARTVESPLR